MEWIKLTSLEFNSACEKADRLCVVPFGCIEKHSEHLPLGTDSYVIEAISIAASEIEPVVIFPVLHFFENASAIPFPGSIALRWEVYFHWFENICEEISRNGFKKILIANGHGGNRAFIHNFLRNSLKTPKPYILYAVDPQDLISKMFREKVLDNPVGSHAGETETSLLLYLYNHLVKMKNLPSEPGISQERLKHIDPASSPLDWIAKFPTHYAGNSSKATAEKGEKLFNEAVKNMADLIKRVKEDKVSARLFDKFNKDAFK
jgi:creatinine amidohydrolase